MKSKKAIFIGPAYPYRGGIAAFNENLASIFQNNGWDCMMFTFTQQYPNFLFPGKNQLTTDDSAPNLNIKRGIYSTNPLSWLKITKEIVALEPDILITQYWMPFMAPAFGTILRGVKKSLPQVYNITIVHNFKPHESLIGDKQLGRFLANRTDLMISLSKNVSQDIQNSVTNKPVSELFHPIYDHYGDKVDKKLARRKLGFEDDCKYLLFFGLIRAYKGLDLLLDAMSMIETDQKYKLIIAGEFYENEKKYRKLISDLNLDDKVIINNGYIPNEEVPYYFCSSDVVVLPYKKATQSGVIPIAIHFEIPIIVTEVGGLSEMIIDNGIGLTSTSDPKAISENLNRFLNAETNNDYNFDNIKNQLSWQNFYDTLLTEIKEHGFDQ